MSTDLDFSFPDKYQHKPNCGWCHTAGINDYNKTTWHVVVGSTLWTSTVRDM